MESNDCDDLRELPNPVLTKYRREFDKKHFKPTKDNTHECKLCTKIKTTLRINVHKMGHSKLVMHVKENHENEYRHFFKGIKLPSQQRIDNFVVRDDSALHGAIVKYFASSLNLSYYRVQSDAFKSFMNTLRPGAQILSRSTLSSNINSLAFKFRSHLKAVPPSYFSLSIDGYTKGDNKVFGVSLNLPNIAKKTTNSHLITLLDCSSTYGSGPANDMRNQIDNVLEEFNLDKSNMTGIFADGTNANLSLFNKICDGVYNEDVHQNVESLEKLSTCLIMILCWIVNWSQSIASFLVQIHCVWYPL